MSPGVSLWLLVRYRFEICIVSAGFSSNILYSIDLESTAIWNLIYIGSGESFRWKA